MSPSDAAAGEAGRTIRSVSADETARSKSSKIPASVKRRKVTSALDIRKGVSVLSEKSGNLESGLYRPLSQLTAGVYKEILGLLQVSLSGESSETLYEAAHETISIFKADESDKVRRERLSEFLPPDSITDELYSSLFRLCGLITDFQRATQPQQQAIDESAGIAVTFDEDDEEKGADMEESSADESDERAAAGRKLIGETDEEMNEEVDEETESKSATPAQSAVNPNDIAWNQIQDGFWLRRELVHAGYHEEEVVTIEQATLDLLATSLTNTSVLENKLFQLFKFKNLNLCKLIVQNKFKFWLAAGLMRDPSTKDVLIGQLLEFTDARASELYREVAQAGHRPRLDESQGYPQPSSLLDLTTLMFEQGGRLMSNPSFTPETKTYQISKKNYDEVHVQAPVKVQVKATDLVQVKTAMPVWAHAAFAGFETLNAIQSKVFPVAFGEFKENVLMCAPTGAGKTNVAMLTIMNVLGQYWVESREEFDLSQFKIVYIAPMKALVQEVVKSFSQRLSPLGVNVRELSGDSNLSREQMADTHVIVTTPEKWDVVTRKAGESRGYTHLVRLIIIDEVHLLHDSRGPVLEAIVARTIRQVEQTQEYVRLVALSATLPNYRDVALFLRVNHDKGLFYFGSEYRPVPLEQTYIGITTKKGLKRAQVTNECVFDKVLEEVGKNQILVFVHGRKETVKTARELRNLAMEKGELGNFLPQDSASKGILEHEAANLKTNELKELLPFGIGIHHAGLPQGDRSAVEDLFAGRHLSVVVCTLTLAWGVNLPAHTVIIKGTQIYMPEKGDWVELSPMDMMQMMGRAGRPQYDTSGHGIVITNKSELQYYLSLNNMQLPIESQLIAALPDLVNAELALGTIATRDDGVRWLGYTYLHVRMLQNPGLYGVPLDEADADPHLLQRRVDLIHSALTVLDKNGLCKYDRRSGQAQITALGRVASYFYLRHESVAVYNQHLKPGMTDMDLLRLFSLSREFKYIPVREEEKVELMKLVELVPIPIKSGAEDGCSKINVLLQAYVSRLSLEGFALMADLVFVTQNAGRLFRALFEIALKRGWSVLARRCLVWCKVVEHRMWPIQTVLRHFRSVPDDVCRKIERKGLSNEEFSLLSAPEIGEVVRAPKLGSSIHHLLSQVPKIVVTAYVQPMSRSTLLMKVDVQPDYVFDESAHSESEFFWVFVEDVSQQHCLYSDQFSVRAWQVKAKAVQTLTFTVPVTEPLPPYYFVRVVSDRWMGSETVRPVSFRHLVLPEKSLPPTELVDMDPVPVTSLSWQMGQSLLTEQGITHLNPVQSQVFASVANSDDHVLLCAPLSSGKGICVDLAIFRICEKFGISGVKKTVYVVPIEALAKEKAAQWRAQLGPLGCVVEALTGEPSQDLKLVESADLVVATAAQWDLVSRKWRTKRTRRVFESIGLFVADHLHLLDTPEGAVMELVVSRMRYIATSLEKETRIRLMGVASAVSNAQDLASWIGASAVFSFHVRAIPLEIVIHGFDLFNRAARQLAMLRPLYTNIVNKAPGGRPVLVFGTDRRQCRAAAVELVMQAVADGKPFQFCHASETVIKEHCAGIREASLIKAIEHGVGYLHGGMSDQDRHTVTSLYRAGAIQVLIVSHELMWGLGLRASLVVVLDTSVYSGTEQQFVDLRAAEVLEMLGCAGRVDSGVGKCVLFCPNSKREFYKKFIHEPLPVESALDESMPDFVNAEISNGTIKSRQDCIDWLTWTLYYRRLTRNPNYYSLQATSHQALSDFLSTLVEEAVDALIQAGMVSEDDEGEVAAGDLGLIASYYSVRVATVELLRRSISAASRRKQLIELLSRAAEFASIPTMPEETALLSQLSSALRLDTNASKVLVLLYAHFHRLPLPADLQTDLDTILPIAHRLVLALVDIASTCGWSKVVLAAMEIGPMLVQAVLPSASPLLQLPHFDATRCEQAAESFEVNDVVDLLSMDEADRQTLLEGLTESEIADVARACNMFPSILVSTSVKADEDGAAVLVRLEREGELTLRGNVVPVYAPLYPKEKEEGWWLLLAGPDGSVEDVKRITIAQQTETVRMRVESKGEFKLVLMSDSFAGCDQEESVVVV